MSDKTFPIPKEHLEKLLKPINRITESCVLEIKDTKIFTFCGNIDKTVLLYASIDIPITVEDELKLNIINIKKLMSGLDALGDSGSFFLTFNPNNIVCSVKEPDGMKSHFTYYLVDDKIIKKPVLNYSRLDTLEYDLIFTLTADKVKKLITASTFADAVSKVYFYTENGVLLANVNDRRMANVDNVTIPITSDIKGDSIETPIPVNLDIFRNLASLKNDINVKFSTKTSLFIFESEDVGSNMHLKYIASALNK